MSRKQPKLPTLQKRKLKHQDIPADLELNPVVRSIATAWLDGLADDDLIRRVITDIRKENGVVTITLDFNLMSREDVIGFMEQENGRQ